MRRCSSLHIPSVEALSLVSSSGKALLSLVYVHLERYISRYEPQLYAQEGVHHPEEQNPNHLRQSAPQPPPATSLPTSFSSNITCSIYGWTIVAAIADESHLEMLSQVLRILAITSSHSAEIGIALYADISLGLDAGLPRIDDGADSDLMVSYLLAIFGILLYQTIVSSTVNYFQLILPSSTNLQEISPLSLFTSPTAHPRSIVGALSTSCGSPQNHLASILPTQVQECIRAHFHEQEQNHQVNRNINIYQVLLSLILSAYNINLTPLSLTPSFDQLSSSSPPPPSSDLDGKNGKRTMSNISSSQSLPVDTPAHQNDRSHPSEGFVATPFSILHNLTTLTLAPVHQAMDSLIIQFYLILKGYVDAFDIDIETLTEKQQEHDDDHHYQKQEQLATNKGINIHVNDETEEPMLVKSFRIRLKQTKQHQQQLYILNQSYNTKSADVIHSITQELLHQQQNIIQNHRHTSSMPRHNSPSLDLQTADSPSQQLSPQPSSLLSCTNSSRRSISFKYQQEPLVDAIANRRSVKPPGKGPAPPVKLPDEALTSLTPTDLPRYPWEKKQLLTLGHHWVSLMTSMRQLFMAIAQYNASYLDSSQYRVQHDQSQSFDHYQHDPSKHGQFTRFAYEFLTLLLQSILDSSTRSQHGFHRAISSFHQSWRDDTRPTSQDHPAVDPHVHSLAQLLYQRWASNNNSHCLEQSLTYQSYPADFILEAHTCQLLSPFTVASQLTTAIASPLFIGTALRMIYASQLAREMPATLSPNDSLPASFSLLPSLFSTFYKYCQRFHLQIGFEENPFFENYGCSLFQQHQQDSLPAQEQHEVSLLQLFVDLFQRGTHPSKLIESSYSLEHPLVVKIPPITTYTRRNYYIKCTKLHCDEPVYSHTHLHQHYYAENDEANRTRESNLTNLFCQLQINNCKPPSDNETSHSIVSGSIEHITPTGSIDKADTCGLSPHPTQNRARSQDVQATRINQRLSSTPPQPTDMPSATIMSENPPDMHRDYPTPSSLHDQEREEQIEEASPAQTELDSSPGLTTKYPDIYRDSSSSLFHPQYDTLLSPSEQPLSLCTSHHIDDLRTQQPKHSSMLFLSSFGKFYQPFYSLLSYYPQFQHSLSFIREVYGYQNEQRLDYRRELAIRIFFRYFSGDEHGIWRAYWRYFSPLDGSQHLSSQQPVQPSPNAQLSSDPHNITARLQLPPVFLSSHLDDMSLIRTFHAISEDISMKGDTNTSFDLYSRKISPVYHSLLARNDAGVIHAFDMLTTSIRSTESTPALHDISPLPACYTSCHLPFDEDVTNVVRKGIYHAPPQLFNAAMTMTLHMLDYFIDTIFRHTIYYTHFISTYYPSDYFTAFYFHCRRNKIDAIHRWDAQQQKRTARYKNALGEEDIISWNKYLMDMAEEHEKRLALQREREKHHAAELFRRQRIEQHRVAIQTREKHIVQKVSETVATTIHENYISSSTRREETVVVETNSRAIHKQESDGRLAAKTVKRISAASSAESHREQHQQPIENTPLRSEPHDISLPAPISLGKPVATLLIRLPRILSHEDSSWVKRREKRDEEKEKIGKTQPLFSFEHESFHVAINQGNLIDSSDDEEYNPVFYRKIAEAYAAPSPPSSPMSGNLSSKDGSTSPSLENSPDVLLQSASQPHSAYRFLYIKLEARRLQPPSTHLNQYQHHTSTVNRPTELNSTHPGSHTNTQRGSCVFYAPLNILKPSPVSSMQDKLPEESQGVSIPGIDTHDQALDNDHELYEWQITPLSMVDIKTVIELQQKLSREQYYVQQYGSAALQSSFDTLTTNIFGLGVLDSTELRFNARLHLIRAIPRHYLHGLHPEVMLQIQQQQQQQHPVEGAPSRKTIPLSQHFHDDDTQNDSHDDGDADGSDDIVHFDTSDAVNTADLGVRQRMPSDSEQNPDSDSDGIDHDMLYDILLETQDVLRKAGAFDQEELEQELSQLRTQ